MRVSRRILSITVAFSILGAMNGAASAATKIGTVGVTLTIVASCAITTPDSSEVPAGDVMSAPNEAADVDCAHSIPFAVEFQPIASEFDASSDQPAMLTVVY